MSTASKTEWSEMAILSRIVAPERPYLSADAAQEILKLDFSAEDRRRMNRLAEKNRRGKLTPRENEELNNFVRVGQTLGILQSKARRSLASAAQAGNEARQS